MKLPPLPDVSRFREWRTAVRSAVSGAYGRPNKAFRWIRRVESKDITYDQLGQLRRRFEALDSKLGAALTNLASGEVARILLRNDEEQNKVGRRVCGRQKLLLIYNYFKTNHDPNVYHTIVDLSKVTFRGDGRLTEFYDQWLAILAGMQDHPPDTAMEELFVDKLRSSQVLREEIAHYDRTPVGQADHSYQFMLRAVRSYLSLKRVRENKAALERSYHHREHALPAQTGQLTAEALAGYLQSASAPPGGWKSILCPDLRRGACRFGDRCRYSHDTNDPAIRSAASALGAGGGSRRSDTPNRKSQPCWDFSKGRCTLGDRCPRAHRQLTRDEEKQRDKSSRAGSRGSQSRSRSPSSGSSSGRSRSSSPSGRSASPRRGKDVCIHFARGSCKFGDKCRYKHELPAAPSAGGSRSGSSKSSRRKRRGRKSSRGKRSGHRKEE